jgi:hypothetical protein
MVTRDQIYERLGQPFQPFRVTLVDGETLDVTRPNQAVVNSRDFIFGKPDGGFRWIRLEEIERIDVFELRQHVG